MRHLRVNEVARRAFDSFLPRSFSLLLALSRFLSHVFCLLFLAFLHAFARYFGKRLLLEKAGNLHHTPLFSFFVPSGLQSVKCCEEIHHQSFTLLWFHRFFRSGWSGNLHNLTLTNEDVFPKITQKRPSS